MLGGAASFPARCPRLHPCGPGKHQPHIRGDGHSLLTYWLQRTVGSHLVPSQDSCVFWGVGLREARPGARPQGLPRDQLGSPGKPSGHRSGDETPSCLAQGPGDSRLEQVRRRGAGRSLCVKVAACVRLALSLWLERPVGPD